MPKFEEDPVLEFKNAANGFVSQIRNFKESVEAMIEKQETRISELDRKMALGKRHGLSGASYEDLPHKKAFNAYLKNGDDAGLRHIELEGKAMTSGIASEGGYLVDPATSETITALLQNSASLRSVANVVQVEATSYDVLIDQGGMGAGWQSEVAQAIETDTPRIERISIPLHELSALPKISQRLLDDSAFDLGTWLAERIAYSFTLEESRSFISGDGIGKPKGFLAHQLVDNDIWEWGYLGTVSTGYAGDFNPAQPADAVVDLVYTLEAQYRANATFVMNSKTAGAVRKMKDADGRFLWSDGFALGEAARLMGYPVLVVEDMPDIADNTTAIAFGDFRAGYTIAERPELRILRDPYSAKPHVLFYATKRIGGDISDFSAIKLLKFSAE